MTRTWPRPDEASDSCPQTTRQGELRHGPAEAGNRRMANDPLDCVAGGRGRACRSSLQGTPRARLQALRGQRARPGAEGQPLQLVPRGDEGLEAAGLANPAQHVVVFRVYSRTPAGWCWAGSVPTRSHRPCWQLASTSRDAWSGPNRRPCSPSVCCSLQASAENDPPVCGVHERNVVHEATRAIPGASVVPGLSPVHALDEAVTTESKKACHG
jgi:hypothetical protein